MVRLHSGPLGTMQLFEKKTFEDIKKTIASLREKKGKEKATLLLIDNVINFGHGFVVNLMWERALSYQHMVMNGDKKSLPKMEAAILVASKYIKDNRLKEWESRAYRFLGRLHDYQGKFTSSIIDYKKAISLVGLDPEPFREFELEGFLSYAYIMSGKVGLGYKLAIQTFDKYNSSVQGRNLKKKDYPTWVIWKSGVPIRTLGAFLSKNINFDKKLAKKWILEIENDLQKGEFSYRKSELKTLKEKLQVK